MRTAVDRPHWSYSSLSQYIKCPLQYYYERVLKLPRKTTSDAQVLGGSIHSALAGYHHKLQAREPILPRHVQDDFLSAWDHQTRQADIVYTGDKTKGDSLALGVALIEAYLQEPPPEGIVSIEQPMLAPLANSKGHYLEKPILAVLDLVTRQDDGTLKVTEIKTSSRSYSESEVATSLQPTCYGNAVYETTGEEPEIEFTVLVKNKVPKVQRIRAVQGISDYQRLGDIVEVVGKAIEAGSFYPIESPLNCSSCSFFRECRGWSGPGDSEFGNHQVLKLMEASPC